MSQDISGAMGGKGGGGGHTPTEAKDTLRARQNVKLLFAINDGLIDSVSGIYLNRTPITEFEGATWEVRTGTVDQTPIDGFDEVESPHLPFSASEIKHDTSFIATFAYSVTAARLTFQVPSLRKIQDDGDIVGHTVQLDIKTKRQGDPLETFFESTVKKGKASNPYSWDIRVPRPESIPQGESWQIVVYRFSNDDSDAKYNSKTFISGITEITTKDPALTYPGTALVGIKLTDAAVFGSKIPEITFRVKGRKIYLPSNYDPESRQYNESSPWDLSFNMLERKWTDNPVWHLYAVLIDFLKIPKIDIDVGAFYRAAKYADQMIDDGKGGTEPRYTINQQFIQRENVPTFLSYLLTLFNGNFTTNSYGQLSLIYDHPGQSVTKIVNNSNVIDGRFTYSSNDLEQRFSLVNVTYNDPSIMGDTSTTTAYDDGLITRYGLQTSDIVLAGCYSEAQAIRKARWAIWTNAVDTQFVNWSVFLEGMNYYVGELVKIQDDKNGGYEYQGRILSSSTNGVTTTLNLDRPVVLAAGESYKINFIDASGETFVQKSVNQSSGTFSTITFSGSTLPIEASVYIIETANRKPIAAKVISIKKSSDFYAISAIVHNEDKYGYVDGSIILAPVDGGFSNNNMSVPQVTNVSVSQLFAENVSKLLLTWDWTAPVDAKYQAIYQVLWRRDGLAWNTVENIETKELDIENPVPGHYDFTIYAINPLTGIKSKATDFAYNYRTEGGTSSLEPPLHLYVRGTEGTVFVNSALSVDIIYDPANDGRVDKLKDYVVEVWALDWSEMLSTYVVNPDLNKNGVFEFTYPENQAVFGGDASRTINIKAYSRDTIGDLSLPASATMSNPAPTIDLFEVTPNFGSVYIKCHSPDKDLLNFRYRRYDQANATGPIDEIFTASSVIDYKIATEEASQQFWFTVAASDVFGYGEETARQSAGSVPLDPDIFTYVGLTFKPNDPGTNQVSWTQFTAYRNGANPEVVAAGNATWTSGTLYLYYKPGTPTMQTTTSLVTAITVGGRVLATYRGGTDLAHDSGKAFISGDQILTGSIGANALVTNTAIITNAAQIDNILQSSNYNWTTGNYAGWRIDKDGTINATALTVRNASGQVVFSSNGIGWGFIDGVPETLADLDPDAGTKLSSIDYGATVGAAFGVNISGKIDWTNVTTYIANGAIGAAQIGSISLIGKANFNVKTQEAGARMEMDASVIKVFDASGRVRVKIGDLGA